MNTTQPVTTTNFSEDGSKSDFGNLVLFITYGQADNI
jgi:hypothetical protein